MHFKQLTAIIHKEDDCYVSFCPELDIASQGSDIEEAKGNLKEAVELFFECASKSEITQRYNG
ncbi:MAG: type II toxin-antitoxin system HicB family antitoxin [Methyloglobulus sp.]|nr:type II toxin-antitoxin system HicB family antitoxin [Methyloglobulus sp.]